MKLFNLLKKKKYKEEENFKRSSREELGLLPEEEELDDDIFVKPVEEKQEYVSTLKDIDSSKAAAPAPAKKPTAKTVKKAQVPTASAKQKTTEKGEAKAVATKPTVSKTANKSNSDTKIKAEIKPTVKKEVPKEVKEVKESASQKLANFEIKKAKDGRFVFNLYASNHVIVATSQIYSTSQAAVNGINSVITNAKKAPIEDTTLKKFEAQPFPKWEIYLDKSEQFRFRLYAPNGSCICHSQGYTSKANCKNGIASIIKSCENSEITKAYLNKDK